MQDAGLRLKRKRKRVEKDGTCRNIHAVLSGLETNETKQSETEWMEVDDQGPRQAT